MRKAFTLVELLVVISITAALSVMVVLVWPRQQPEVDGVVSLQGWLVGARCKALRDQRSVGLRVVNGVPSFIEQPDDWTLNQAATFVVAGSTITATGNFGSTQAKDMVEMAGDVAVIKTASPTQLTCILPPGSSAAYWTRTTSDWRIVRQPVAMMGGTPLKWSGATLVPDQDVLFAPNGMLVGTTAPVRWTIGNQYVVQVQPGTGAVQVNPVAPGADPFAYCRDGKGGGF